MADEKTNSGPPNPKPDDAAALGASTSVQPIEPEDAYLTGGKRSLQRRVLGLNVDDDHGQAQRNPATPGGQHATGSFPDASESTKSK